MSPLDRLAVCAGKMLAHIEMYFPGFADDALEETPLVDAEAEIEVHEPARRPPPLTGAAWNRPVAAPRIAQSLGVDERDAEWVSEHGNRWRWDRNRWWSLFTDGEWMPAPDGYRPSGDPPYTAVEEMDWHGWAVPAILECLAEWPAAETEYDTYEEWCEGIAPRIADRIACDPERALNALRNDRLHR